MKRIIMALLAIGDISIRGLPVEKQENAIVTLPNLQVSFEEEDSNIYFKYDPCLSIKYPLWQGGWLNHPVEISYIVYRLEHEYRSDISQNWKSHMLAIHLNMADEIEWQGGAYYELGGRYDVTGATEPDYNRYRLVVEVHGFTSNDLEAAQNLHHQFNDCLCSPWVYATDTIRQKSAMLNLLA